MSVYKVDTNGGVRDTAFLRRQRLKRFLLDSIQPQSLATGLEK